MLKRKSLTNEQALQKLSHYCSYQERCHSEVRTKLYQLGISKKFHDELIAELIQQNYLNEERFAMAFARGKFKMNQWGKRKIMQALKERGVSEYCIKIALKEITDTDYNDVLLKLATKKLDSLNGENLAIKKIKLMQWLTGKGFQPLMVAKTVNALLAKQ